MPRANIFTGLLLIAVLGLCDSAGAQDLTPVKDEAYRAQPRMISEPDFSRFPAGDPLPASIDAELKVLADGSIAEMKFAAESDERLVRALREAATLWQMYPAIGPNCLPTQSTQRATVYFKRNKENRIVIDIATGGSDVHPTPVEDSKLGPKVTIVAWNLVRYPHSALERGIDSGWVRVVGRVGPGDTISDLYVYASAPPNVFDDVVTRTFRSARVAVSWGADQTPRADWSRCYVRDYNFTVQGERERDIPIIVKTK